MRRFLLTVSITLSFSSIAFAQEYRVLGIAPQSGPSTGGTHVAIRMNGFPTCPILAPPPTVYFGGVAAQTFEGSSTDWVVIAPPHAPGLVDVRVTACGMEDIAIANGFSYFQAPAGGPFQVESITPAFGPIAGGTEVTIKVTEIPVCTDPIPAPAVTFGGVAATNIRMDFGADTITAIAPAHAAGTVDLELTTCAGPTVTIGSGYTYIAGGQNPNPAYEKVLFPVLFFGPGARGSQWATKISVYNAADVPLTSANAVFFGDPACPAACGCQATARIDPGQTAIVCGAGFADPSGLMFYPPKLGAGDVHYHARVFDTSRSTMNAGTEIPVVREREFRTDEIVLQDLPLDPNFRLAIRVYNPDQRDGAQVRMQVLGSAGGEVLGERVIDLSYPIVNVQPIQPDPYPNRPAFAYLDLDPIVRSMLGAGFGTTHRSVSLKITPVTSDTRFWAFASITNNETQLITTITPQY